MDKIKLLRNVAILTTVVMFTITLTACISQPVQPIKQNNAQQIIKKQAKQATPKSATEKSAIKNPPQKDEVLVKVANKIYRYLYPPVDSGHDYTHVTITVDKHGKVIKMLIKGSNSYLNRAVEQAVNSASPLPITPKDKFYPTFRILFEGRGNYW